MLSYKRVATNFVQPSKRKLQLSEAYRDTDQMPQFAIMAENGEQIGAWMRCKDYIQDVIWGSKQSTAYSVHGWEYDPKVDPRTSDKWLILAMRWPTKSNEDFDMAIENAKATIEDVEKHLNVPKFQRSRFSRRIGDHFVIYGEIHWLKSAGTVSLLTWILRASLTNTKRTFESLMKMKTFSVPNDGYYAKSGKLFIDHLIEVGFDGIVSDWATFKEAYNVHGNGFVGQSRKIAQQKGVKINYGMEDDDAGMDDGF